MRHLILSTLTVLLVSCNSSNVITSKKKCTIPGGTVCVKCDNCLPIWRRGICNHCSYIPPHAVNYVEEYHAKIEHLKNNKEYITLLASVNRFGDPINTFDGDH